LLQMPWAWFALASMLLMWLFQLKLLLIVIPKYLFLLQFPVVGHASRMDVSLLFLLWWCAWHYIYPR
jgi:hypothetical protein